MHVSPRARANLLLLLTAAIWGFAFSAQVVAAHIGAFTFNASRFALGALSLLPVIAWLDRRAGVDRGQARRRWRAVLVPGLICGAVLFVGSNLQQVGLETTTAGNAAFITGLYVVLVPLVGLFFGRRVPPLVWLGALLAVAGLAFLTLTSGVAAVNGGDLLCLASSLFWTTHILVVGHFSRHLDVLRLSVAQFASNAALGTLAAFAVEPHPFVGVIGELGPVLYAGFISVGVAFTLQVVAQRDALESHAALIMSLETVFGALGGALFLGERMGPLALLGAALMFAGIVASQLGPIARPDADAAALPVPEPPSTTLADDPLQPACEA